MDQLVRWSKEAERWRFFPAPVWSGSEAASSPEYCMSDTVYFVKSVHLVFSWLFHDYYIYHANRRWKSHQWRCFLPGTPALPALDTKQKKREIHTHTQAHLQETSHMPTHSPTGQIPLWESQTHQNQWSHSCSQPQAKMEMDHVGGSNHLTAGGPRFKVRWRGHRTPNLHWIRTWTGFGPQNPTGRCHWPGWRKEVELLQSLPCLLWCVSEEDVERDETWAGGTWASDIASVPVGHSRTQLWSHLSRNHDSYF